MDREPCFAYRSVILKRLLLLLAALAAPQALAYTDPPRWTSIVVTFSLEHDGSVFMTEHATVEIPPGTEKVEREFWSGAEQVASVARLTYVDPETRAEKAIPFEEPYDGKVRWKPGELPSPLTYDLVMKYSTGLAPAWSFARGDLTRADNTPFAPRERLAALLPLWREAWPNRQHRYLFDVQYDLPRDAEKTTDLRFNLEFDKAFELVHPVSPDSIVRRIEPDFYNPMRWRATHLFDYKSDGVPATVDLRAHQLRMAAVIGFPLAALLLWLFFILRELPRGGVGGEIGEGTLQATLYDEAPEVIAARWSGDTPVPRIEPWLRRLESQHKVELKIEGEDDVTVRLLVPRGELSPYDRPGIDALMGSSNVITSRDVRSRGGDSVTDVLYLQVQEVAKEMGANAKMPWYAKATNILLFAGGFVLAGQEVVRYHREPILNVAGLVLGSALTSLFPDRFVRWLIARSRWWSLALLLPIALCTFAVGFVHLAANQAPTWYGSVGFSLMLLAICKSILDATAARPPKAARIRRAELARARKWLRNELRQPYPRIDPSAAPWLKALGLTPPPHMLLKEEEDWGW